MQQHDLGSYTYTYQAVELAPVFRIMNWASRFFGSKLCCFLIIIIIIIIIREMYSARARECKYVAKISSFFAPWGGNQ